MDNGQKAILEANGFAVTRVPNLNLQPRAIYFSRDGGTGAIVKHNLPSDPYSLRRYTQRGFVLRLEDLQPQAEDKLSEQPAVNIPSKRVYKKRKNKNSVGGK